MRLPDHLVNSRFFSFETEADFWRGVAGVVNPDEKGRIEELLKHNLLPITSKEVLATLIGVNPGLIWSFVNRRRRYYRRFPIPKGKGFRTIFAPRVGLKIIQKWISIHIENQLIVHNHVYGFVSGRSHIEAAGLHCPARWVYSLDIEDFFPSTTEETVRQSLMNLNYDEQSASLIASVCCLDGVLAQGSPSSPVLSNLAFKPVDEKLVKIAAEMNIRLTRYADDITFSSERTFPKTLAARALRLLRKSDWKFSKRKTHFSEKPGRLKVHGLLVDGTELRLTKGYRNRIRAYEHLLEQGKVKEEDYRRILGHLNYANQIKAFNENVRK